MQNGYFLGCYDLNRFQESELKQWILDNVCDEFKKEEWELNYGDDQYDYYLYDLKSCKEYYVDVYKTRVKVFENPVYIFER